jgi:hypothetical protein
LRGAEDPQKLRELSCRATQGVSETAASYGSQRENVEQLRPPCSRCGKPLLLTRIEPEQPGVEIRIYYCASSGPGDRLGART